jgi:hypothetical protein
MNIPADSECLNRSNRCRDLFGWLWHFTISASRRYSAAMVRRALEGDPAGEQPAVFEAYRVR